MRKWFGNLLIGLSVCVFASTLCFAYFAGRGAREHVLRALQTGLTEANLLMRETAPLCDDLSARSLPELCRTVGELRRAVDTLEPVARFMVSTTEFRIVELYPFGEYRQAAADFRQAVPVMQRAAATAEAELCRLQRNFPGKCGERLRRIGPVLENGAVYAGLGAEFCFLIVPGILFIGSLLSLLTFLNGYFLRGGFSVPEKKENGN